MLTHHADVSLFEIESCVLFLGMYRLSGELRSSSAHVCLAGHKTKNFVGQTGRTEGRDLF